MARVRSAAVAGTFYPADAGELRDQVQTMLDVAARVDRPESDDRPGVAPISVSASERRARGRGSPAALIAPHAGYVYSGPIAARAFGTLRRRSSGIDRVVIIGPSHFVPFGGIALPDADVMDTPLGSVPLDREACDRVRRFPHVATAAEPHRREHALEVELPFLQIVLGDFSVVPLVTGDATPQQVAEVLEAVWDHRTLVVVSSDLSHFHDYDTARRLDRATADAIVEGRPHDLGRGSACGRLAIQGLLAATLRRCLDVSLLDLRSSGDTAGGRDEVVGYGAFRIA